MSGRENVCVCVCEREREQEKEGVDERGRHKSIGTLSVTV